MKRTNESKNGLSVVKNNQLQKEEKNPETGQITLGTWETQDFIQASGLCFRCHSESAMGLLTGQPGSGKTTVIKTFCQRFDDAFVITAKVTMAARDMLEAIARAINVTVYGGNNQRFEQLAEALKSHPATLIIDETENLITRSSIAKIQILRQLHDAAGTAIIFCGTPDLKDLITRGPSGRDNLSMIYRRIVYCYELVGIKSKEAEDILSRYEMIHGAREELMKIATNVNKGGIGILSNVLNRCLAFAQKVGKPIDKDIVRQATSMMLF